MYIMIWYDMIWYEEVNLNFPFPFQCSFESILTRLEPMNLISNTSGSKWLSSNIISWFYFKWNERLYLNYGPEHFCRPITMQHSQNIGRFFSCKLEKNPQIFVGWQYRPTNIVHVTWKFVWFLSSLADKNRSLIAHRNWIKNILQQ